MNAIIESMNAWGFRFAGFALPMLLQSVVLIGVLFALDLALRKRVRATIRYAVWMLALVKLALPPSLASPTGAAYWLPAEQPAEYSAMTPVSTAAPEELVITTRYKPVGAVGVITPLDARSPGLTWQAIFLVVWLVVASGVGIWVVLRLRVVVGVIRQSAEASEPLLALLESCRRQLGIKRLIPLRCAAIGSPAICGVLRPIILIPPGLVENLGEAEMRAVLLHELAHYKRGDLWVNHVQIFLQVVYWYNPLLWLANASIRRAREQAVDEMVLVEMGEEAQTYPATLLHVAKLGMGRPNAALGVMGILEPGRGLTRRIVHIMNRPLPRTARIGAMGLGAVLLLALVALPMACRRKDTPAKPAPIGMDTNTTRDDGVVEESTTSIASIPTGKLAFVTSSNFGSAGKICIIAGDRRTTTRSYMTRDLEFLPDGKQIIYSANDSDANGIYIYDLMQHTNILIMTNVESGAEPSWSSEGTKIAFVKYTEGRKSSQIYTANYDGSEWKQLTEGQYYNWTPRWSPDGQKLLFETTRNDNPDTHVKNGGYRDIYVMDRNGQNQISLTGNSYGHHPSWSPDGKSIAYMSHGESGKANIFVMRADGSSKQNISKGITRDSEPVWSPDGQWIAFTRTANTFPAQETMDIWIMKSDGTEQRPVTFNTTDFASYCPTWSK